MGLGPGRWRRSVAAGLVGVLAGVALAVTGPAAPALALPLDDCYDNARPQHGDAAFWAAPGNHHTPWAAPAGIQDGDVFKIRAHGTIRIDHWGTSKNIAGELPAPGRNSGWPAPDSPRWALVGKVTAGSVWSPRTGLIYGANRWFPVGTDSWCVLFSGWDVGTPQMVFSFNDPNLGDNGGGAQVSVHQWWS
jgi:hypothetical protein